MEETYITPTHIKDYAFCPTILYHKYVRGVIEPKTPLMEEGRLQYLKDAKGSRERTTLLNSRRIKVEKMLFSYKLTSNKHKIHGIADTIYWTNNKMHILEIKYSNLRKPMPGHIYQTAAYALMAEETFKQPAYKIIIYYKPAKKWIEKRYTNQLRAYTIKIIQKTREILEGEEIPEIKWRHQCRSCWYRKFCWP